MTSSFLFVPDPETFQLVKLQITNSTIETHAHTLFKECFLYFIDTRERVIYITLELRSELKEKGILPENIKRLNMFSIIDTHDTPIEASDTLTGLLRLCSSLVFETNKEIYFVTDNEGLRDIINSREKKIFTAISSKDATQILKERKLVKK